MLRKKSSLIFFVGLVLILILVSFYNNNFIYNDAFYRNIFLPYRSISQINELVITINKWNWIGYFFIPLILILKIFFIWVCLKAGSIITETFTQIPFWKICIQAEIVFAIGAVAGILHSEFFADLQTLEQISLNPFSLHIFVFRSVPLWSHYLFSTINLFELAYVLFLAYIIADESKKAFLPSLKFVASTYLPGLALWVLLVSYLSVVFQP